jgi:hypothetical protein
VGQDRRSLAAGRLARLGYAGRPVHPVVQTGRNAEKIVPGAIALLTFCISWGEPVAELARPPPNFGDQGGSSWQHLPVALFWLRLQLVS